MSKRYRLGNLGTLRSTLGALTSPRGGDDRPRDLWALKDVSFRVEPGDSLGLIGPNGAGKTTALKILSHITRPTDGSISVTGRVSSLIELGAGFHPELTGRENIFLNGAILGMQRHEIQRKLGAIIAFSELERFMDTPVKRYSSGMYVRLGFAVAAHVEPDVLLVDEVLAVGDASFRQKCLDRMKTLLDEGTTVLFVSHNMYLVQRLCDRALLLTGGKPRYLGPAAEAIEEYKAVVESGTVAGSTSARESDSQSDPAVMITGVCVTNASGQPIVRLHHSEDALVRVTYRTRSSIYDPIIKIRIVHNNGAVAAMAASRYQRDTQWTLRPEGVISARIHPIQLASGLYHMEVRIIDTTDSKVLASGQTSPFHVSGPSLAHEVDRGFFVPNVHWKHSVMPSEL